MENKFPSVFGKLWMQIVHFVTMPLFFVAFSKIYKPFDLLDFFTTPVMNLDFNLVMVGCIILLSIAITRMLVFLLRNVLKWNTLLYVLWCLMEIVIVAQFMTLYLALMHGAHLPYFLVLGKCITYSLGVLVYPYVIIGLYGVLHEVSKAPAAPEDDSLIRFKDYTQKLKFAIAPSALLYIQAEENYVKIHYTEADSIKVYVLRASMKSIEETVSKYGILRCHRSYFLNPSNVSLLRKDKDLGVTAEFNAPGAPAIPVSKSYYESISKII